MLLRLAIHILVTSIYGWTLTPISPCQNGQWSEMMEDVDLQHLDSTRLQEAVLDAAALFLVTSVIPVNEGSRCEHDGTV